MRSLGRFPRSFLHVGCSYRRACVSCALMSKNVGGRGHEVKERFCFGGCQCLKPKDAFTANQWDKDRSDERKTRRCKECVANNVVPCLRETEVRVAAGHAAAHLAAARHARLTFLVADMIIISRPLHSRTHAGGAACEAAGAAREGGGAAPAGERALHVGKPGPAARGRIPQQRWRRQRERRHCRRRRRWRRRERRAAAGSDGGDVARVARAGGGGLGGAVRHGERGGRRLAHGHAHARVEPRPHARAPSLTRTRAPPGPTRTRSSRPRRRAG